MNSSNPTPPQQRPAAAGRRHTVKTPHTLLPYLLEWLAGQQSATSIKTLLRHGQISLNGRPTTHHNTPLHPGDELLITHHKTPPPFHHPQLKILWQDNHLIVINKSEGLLSVADLPSRERTAHHLLTQHVKKTDPRNHIYPLHRLDKGTSGLMMFARNRPTQEHLRTHWHTMITRRTYLAIIEGIPPKTHDTIITHLAENNRMKVYCTPAPHGKKAITHYRLLQSNATSSLLELNLETGRKHQIRVHMAHIGHPIAGDPKYGAQTDPSGRLLLHAIRLHFLHPVTGEELRFETPIPQPFLDAIKPSKERK